ncbi:MAG: 16S rRNA (guanine(527)-N(7))-methyltransferase RsmG [Bacteroidales bacterium]|jgi:16S rRNA (guanine527-N7)-methyltransferase
MIRTDADIVFDFFPHLDPTARSRILQLADIYAFWNARINVVSRKDVEHLYIRHVLHSLSLSLAVRENPFLSGKKILDVGTGGGFPGIPLAIIHPECHFVLCDSIRKKIKVTEEAAKALQLENVTTVVSRAEHLKADAFDAIVSRAVTRLARFLPWVHNRVVPGGRLLFLKGGDLSSEIEEAATLCGIPEEAFTVISLSDCFGSIGDGFFTTKKICEIKQTSYLCAPLC